MGATVCFNLYKALQLECEALKIRLATTEKELALYRRDNETLQKMTSDVRRILDSSLWPEMVIESDDKAKMTRVPIWCANQLRAEGAKAKEAWTEVNSLLDRSK